ncbi:CAPSL [Branchiostoma lanceolatum]|uniref:CAPSL protein n=1 Tax=Branchiostoma lanceolatum TaxID=7740 RepID=A0A8J9YXV2_BRALA|nr:CAPSL [Branchiostoma lanceolatum]
MSAALKNLRDQCLKRGSGGIKGLGRTFRIMDDDGNKSLNFEEFEEGCTDYGLKLTKDELHEIFNTFDKDGSGTLHFDEFLIGIRSEMSDGRQGIVKQAFEKADKSGDGVITPADMKGVYNVREHPKYKNGEWTENQCFEEFLKTFEPDSSKRDGSVTFEEFLNYYAGVSASIDNDAYFNLMMRNAWKI